MNLNSALKFLLATTVLAFAVAPSARAQLTFTGSSHGSFIDPGLSNTSVMNGPVTSVFESGVPFRASDTTSSVKFTGMNFDSVGSGDLFQLGTIDIRNGMTLLGSTAGSASMDLYLNLPDQGINNFKLTTLLFTIDNTANNGVGNVPDLFTIKHTAVNSLMVGGRQITFDLQLTNPAFGIDGGAPIAETHTGTDDLWASFNFVPVPEASTFALWGAALLGGLIFLRGLRHRRAAAAPVA